MQPNFVDLRYKYKLCQIKQYKVGNIKGLHVTKLQRYRDQKICACGRLNFFCLTKLKTIPQIFQVCVFLCNLMFFPSIFSCIISKYILLYHFLVYSLVSFPSIFSGIISQYILWYHFLVYSLVSCSIQLISSKYYLQFYKMKCTTELSTV